jgi:hypothetical protein
VAAAVLDNTRAQAELMDVDEVNRHLASCPYGSALP